MKHYGIEVTKEMESILVNELTRSIDAEIMSKILGKPLKRREKIKKILNDKIK